MLIELALQLPSHFCPTQRHVSHVGLLVLEGFLVHG